MSFHSSPGVGQAVSLFLPEGRAEVQGSGFPLGLKHLFGQLKDNFPWKR